MNIKEMLVGIERIFDATDTVIATMRDGDRMQLKELAQTVGLAVAMEPKHVLHFVNHFVHNSNVAYVTRGKNGGVIKGIKIAKSVKIDDSTVSNSPALLVDPLNDVDE